VILTDHEGNIDWLRENVELNRGIVGNRAIKTAVLGWGNESEMSAMERELGNGAFDVIVGSDLIYDPNSHQALTKTMRQFAMPGNATVFLGYPNRGSSEPKFFCATEEYFDIKITSMGDDENNILYAVCQIRE
jgi:predicted nicotinamide N-methyase